MRRGRKQATAAARPRQSAAGSSVGSRRPLPKTGGSLMTGRPPTAPAQTTAVSTWRFQLLDRLPLSSSPRSVIAQRHTGQRQQY